MSRIGNRVSPGRYSVGSWMSLEASEAQKYLEQQNGAFDRPTVIRCVYAKGADFPEHSHPGAQITLVEEGILEFEMEGHAIAVRKGEVITIEPKIRHATRLGAGCERAVALNIFLANRAAVRPEGGTGSSQLHRVDR